MSIFGHQFYVKYLYYSILILFFEKSLQETENIKTKPTFRQRYKKYLRAMTVLYFHSPSIQSV